MLNIQETVLVRIPAGLLALHFVPAQEMPCVALLVHCLLFSYVQRLNVRELSSQLQPIQLCRDQRYMRYCTRKSPLLFYLITMFICVRPEPFCFNFFFFKVHALHKAYLWLYLLKHQTVLRVPYKKNSLTGSLL